MKLKNKKTGEIGEIGYIGSTDGSIAVNPINRVACETIASYNSLAELNEEWEDVPEEPKEYWYIAHNGTVECFEYDDAWQDIDFNWQDKLKQIGNYFETKEEAEKAVEKLKAWKRLKDNGFMIAGWDYEGFGMKVEAGRISFEINKDCNEDKDLDTCFGGEE